MPSGPWPSSRDYVEAIQNPQSCFDDPDLKTAHPALDRMGMPTVTSGQFAYVFKLNHNSGAKAQAVRCFRGSSDGREHRYKLIDDHLDKVSSPFSASFEYDAGGIRVRGQPWPTLVMEWIDGHALDAYLDQVYSKPDALTYLADMWLKALQSLRDNGMAHGDLQHGNVIVDRSNTLRLVDLDGMFVPAMAGWKAPELGHRHYQHPRRSEKDFGASLDNFSGLVIYLSLIALKQSPALWKKYHDENLILVKRDFEDPKNSPVLRDIRALGGDGARLAGVLEQACRDEPLKCPSVLDLTGSAPSRLPLWMTSVPVISVDHTTREVKPGTSPGATPPRPASPVGAPAGASPWWQQGLGATAHSQSTTPVSPSSVPSSSTPMRATPSVRTVALPAARHALTYAFIGIFFSWAWFPIINGAFLGLGATTSNAGSYSIFAFAAVCAALGYRRARSEAQPSRPTPFPIPRAPSMPRVSVPAPRAGAARPSGGGVVVGSSIRLIYHSPYCKWAQKISSRNRVTFSSTADARNAGYRACGVCSP